MKNSLLLHLHFKANRMKGIIIFLFLIMMVSFGVLKAQTENSLDFDGTSKNYVSVMDNDALDFTKSSSYTLEAWIKVDQGVYLGGIISKYMGNATHGYVLRLGENTTRIGLNFDEMRTNDGIISVGKWYHIAAVNNGGARHHLFKWR